MTSRKHHTIIAPWDEVFPSTSRQTFGVGHDIAHAGAEANHVYVVEKGAVVETRSDSDTTSHAVNLLGPGSLIGLRMTSTGAGIHEVRATALVESVLRGLPRDHFLACTQRRADLGAAIMHDLARRTEVARRLSDSCQLATTDQHVLDVLEIVSNMFGRQPNGLSTIAVPPALLERMTGCPWVLIRQSLNTMLYGGRIVLESGGVRVRTMVN